MKSNQYVYPSLGFKNLSHSKDKYTIVGETIADFAYFKNLLEKIPKLKVNIKGSNIAAQVFSIFLSNQIIFGPKKFISEDRVEFLKQIRQFTDRNKALQFSFLGFPFKIPMPLKTKRTLPDMGEVLALHRLFLITQLIAKIYKPGGVINIFTEGAFADFANISETEARAYDKQLQILIYKFGYNKTLKIIPLARMKKTANFKSVFSQIYQENLLKFKRHEKGIMRAYQEAGQPIEKIVNTRMYDTETLKDVFNPKFKGATSQVTKIRNDIQKRGQAAFIKYLYFIQTKNKINFVEKTIGPNLPLSVSPKRGRLGIFPIDKKIEILAFHGVPLHYARRNEFDIQYLVDLQAMPVKVRLLYLKGDPERSPFCYEII